jgi:hypothetical protein
MKITSRIKRLEKKLLGNQELWAVFTIGYYEDSHEKDLAEKCLLSEYLSKGNPRPSHCVFTNDMPGPTKQDQHEGFLYSFSR